MEDGTIQSNQNCKWDDCEGWMNSKIERRKVVHSRSRHAMWVCRFSRLFWIQFERCGLYVIWECGWSWKEKIRRSNTGLWFHHDRTPTGMVGASIDHAPNCCGPCGGVSIPAGVPQSASQAVPRRVPAHRCFEWTSRSMRRSWWIQSCRRIKEHHSIYNGIPLEIMPPPHITTQQVWIPPLAAQGQLSRFSVVAFRSKQLLNFNSNLRSCLAMHLADKVYPISIA